MEKLKMQTPDLTEQNIEKIARLFPNVITEKEDENGNIVKGINFDLLRQELSHDLVEDDDERYRLDWPGKKASILKANTPINKTLRPVKEDSVYFENTENLYIEGDNFEVLKILQESYLNKVKMIYIDPPYNTGKDFIYKDNFKQSRKEYEEEIGLYDEEGGKLFKNTDTNGHFHSDWLSMMYERLVIARDLLKEDGVIFVSIDDNEVTNLRKIMDEIFGEENFASVFVIKSNPRGSQSTTYSANVHEYVLCYVKDNNNQKGFSIPLNENMLSEYNLEDDHGKYRLLGLRLRGGAWRREDRPLLYYPIYINPITGDISIEPNSEYTHKVLPIKPSTQEDGTWRWSKEKLLKNKSLIIAKKITRDNVITWDIFQKDYLHSKDGQKKETKPKTIWDEKEVNYQNGTNEVKALFDNLNIFDFPKPTFLLKRNFNMIGDKNALILDFFSGSATTAHAVMQLNAEDGGNRKYIMVQLPELTDEKSEAFKAGYKTIADIGKERIRRAGKKIKQEFLERYRAELEKLNTKSELEFDDTLKTKKEELQKKIEHIKNLDTGFRVFKTNSSCMKDVFYHPSEVSQEQLDMFISNIKEDRTPEDFLTQVMLDLGLELSLPIEEKTIQGNRVFFVQHNALIACFDESIDFGIVDEIAKIEPLKVVFRDAGFKDDKDRINVETRFKRLSPETQVTVI